MIEPLTFLSPLSLPDCLQRLEKLAEKKHFHCSSGRFIVHIKIDAIETRRDSFTLYAVCSPQRFDLPAFVFFRLIGTLHPADNGTAMRLWLRLHKPFSKAEWGYLVFWVLILVLALTGGMIGAISSTFRQGLFIALAFVLAGTGYAWMLYQSYKVGRMHILNVVYKALRQDGSATSLEQDADAPEWMSSLSKSH